MSAGVLDGALHDVREYFSLREAAARANALSPASRRALARDVRLSAQRRAAAEVLMRAAAPAEALRLMHEAHGLLAPHAELVGRPLRDVGELPVFDEECDYEHTSLFESLLEEQVALQVALAPLGLEPRERTHRVNNRRATAGAIAFGMVLGLGWWLGRTQLVAEASGSWSEKYPPSNAVDGNESTHWVMPDKSLGWLDVKIVPPRKLTTVSVLPGYEPATYGVVDYRLEAYVGSNVVKSVDGTFVAQPGGGKPPWSTIVVPVDVKVDKVRLVVKSYHDIGGSIAEVKIP